MNKINFIQIGANIGNTDTDFIWTVSRENKWNGIFIEPIPSSYIELVENYKDMPDSHFENIAISNHTGSLVIFSQENSQYSSQQASINPSHWSGRNKLKHTVDCMTLNDLVDKYDLSKKRFDLLQIDAEGHDGVILLATDFNIVCPDKIRFEKCHMLPAQLNKVIEHLTANRYIEIEDEYSSTKIPGEIGIDIMFKKQ